MPVGRTTSFALVGLLILLSPVWGETPTEDRPRNEATAVKIRHVAADGDGWAVAETANFRVYYREDQERADKAATAAERTRAAVQRRWFGETAEAWESRCDLYLQATASVPGRTMTQTDGNRVLCRRIDLQADHRDMLTSVLPHEVAHAVLAGQFGDRPVPKWVDEGIAMLTEPEDRRRKYLGDLDQFRDDERVQRTGELIQSRDYPDPRSLRVFYDQSVSLVDFLAQEKGAPVFTTFVRAVARDGYEKALKRYYGWDGDELERRWRKHAFGDKAARTTAP
jgi:hypothetical protein